jgi:hypothetical protein
MARLEKTIFISYRRTDVYIALAVYENLKNQGYDVLFDYRSISSGDFEQIINSNIRARAHFLLILTPTALDRCNEPGDWLRREIEVAMDEKRNIVPLFFKGFRFGDLSVTEKLTGKLENLSRYNGLNVHEDYFDEAMHRLQIQYLSIPLDTVLQPVSTEVQKAVRAEQVAANKALEQILEQIDIKELVKQADEKPIQLAERDPVPDSKVSLPLRIPNFNFRLIGGLAGGALLLALLVWGGARLFKDRPSSPPEGSPTSHLTDTTPLAAPTTVVFPTALHTMTSAPPTPLPSITSPPTNLPAATQTAAPPSLEGIMLFASNRDGNSEIYGLILANQSLTRLTNNAAQDMQPALAPDSVQVAYVTNQDGNNEIYLSGLDPWVPLNLTNNSADDQQPTWSPDGNWIAFTTNRDGNQEIYVMRSDGSQIRNLTNNPANDFAPNWFSVGGLFGSQDWIAFTSTRDGNQEIYKVRPDGSGLTNLTRNPANDSSPAGFSGGASLAFVTDRDGNPEIYTMNDNGGSQTNLTNNPAQDLYPAINSNGSWVAFSTDRDGNLEVYVVGVNGDTAYNLTRNPGQDRQPDW